jgi:uncharacterized membrane protein
MKKDKLKFYFILTAILSLIGFADATYLTAVHFLDAAPGCGEQGGCDEVASSEYSVIFGVPVALFGILYYLLVFGLTLYWFDRKNPAVPRWILYIVSPALLFSLWLVYLMFFVIEAICWWCMLSATSTAIIFVTTSIVVLKLKE